MDPEDAVTKHLAPGEKVLWTDHPHRVGRAILRTLADEWWIAFLVSPAFAFTFFSPIGWVPYAGALTIVVALAIIYSRRVELRLGTRYFATSHARLFTLAFGELEIRLLPPPDAITTRAKGNEEFGDIHLGKEHVLRDVSYPLIALGTLRAAARKDG